MSDIANQIIQLVGAGGLGAAVVAAVAKYRSTKMSVGANLDQIIANRAQDLMNQYSLKQEQRVDELELSLIEAKKVQALTSSRINRLERRIQRIHGHFVVLRGHFGVIEKNIEDQTARKILSVMDQMEIVLEHVSEVEEADDAASLSVLLKDRERRLTPPASSIQAPTNSPMEGPVTKVEP